MEPLFGRSYQPESSRFLRARSMPTAYRMHYQVALGDLGHDLDCLCKGLVINSQMLHGIQMKPHSNTTVVHRRDEEGDYLFRLHVELARSHSVFVMCPM